MAAPAGDDTLFLPCASWARCLRRRDVTSLELTELALDACGPSART
jgi:hypothetical protein